MRRVLLLAVALLVGSSPGALAQLASGNIYGRVLDESGAAMAGATITLTGTTIGARSTIAGTQGDFRFLELHPGTYKLVVSLTGFTTVSREVLVSTGSSVTLSLALKVGNIEENLVVTAETPVVDSKRVGTSTTFSQDELLKVPNSRDPWALLRTVPGMVLDRVNIAGNESGQQSAYRAKGARGADGVWNLDGVNITDMAATGAAPTYFDYDAFEEIQISTSGNDIRQPTSGVGINLVSKRGSNSFHGTVRGYFTHDDLEWSNVPGELAARTPPVTPATADHNRQIADYGVDLGGPILKDKIWFWGSYGKQDIRLVRSAGSIIDKTLLIDTNIKLNWQASSKDMISVLWFRGAKQKFGRATGAAQVEAATAVWNQDDNYPEGAPPGLWKIQDDHVFSPSLFVTTKYAYYGTGFKLESSGPMDQQAGISALQGQTFGSTRSVYYLRPQHTANLDGNYFRNAFGGTHEVKFGVGYRRTSQEAFTVWPGDKVVGYENSATDKRARLYRDGLGKDQNSYWSLYLGDTFERGRLTLNVGVRYDRQSGKALPSAIEGNTAFSNLVPGIDFAGYDAPFTWSDVSPRAGFTLALDQSRKTVVRANFARYAGQLGTEAAYLNTAGSVGFADYRWTDANGDHFAQPSEVNTGVPPITFGGGFNPASPTAVTSPNRFDADFKAPITTEFVVGFDRELAPNLGVSVAYAYRRYTRFSATPRLNFTDADYAPGTAVTGTLPDGTPYGIPTFIPNATKVTAAGGGRLLTNREGYSQQFGGLDLAITKRLANKWMFRLAAGYNDHTEHFDGTARTGGGQLTRLDGAALVNGGQVAEITGGSGAGDVALNAKWSANVYALYQLPWSFEIAANVFGKQGTPFPIYKNVALGQDGSNRVLVSPEVDTFRFDDVWNVDLRLAKNFKAGGVHLTLAADVFNLLNTNTAINRQRNQGSTAFNQITQNVSPRILRFGLRLGF